MEHEDSDTDLDILNNLMSNDIEEIEQPEQPEQSEQPKLSETKRTLTELQFSFLDSAPSNTDNEDKPTNEKVISEIYDDKLDSSDDEDKRYFEEQKYSNYGRNIKQLLKGHSVAKLEQPIKLSQNNDKIFTNSNNNKTFNFNNAIKSNKNDILVPKDVYSDPFFGIRIVSPLVSSSELKERMEGKIAVTISRVKNHIISDNVHNDWVIAGVLINKSDTKTSQKGTSYCIWKISDLSDDLKTVTVFLFSNAYKQLWKTITGSVISILNPNVLESKDNVDQATLSIDNPQKMMILGRSKDMGKCKSVKKNGDACTAVVNISRCEYCIYHVKQEYKKCSRRADLLSSNNGHGFTGDALKRMNKQNMRQPYNGMAPFVPVFAKRNEQLYEKDRARLEMLAGVASGSTAKKAKDDRKSEVNADIKKKGIAVELTNKQSKLDHERLNKLRGWQAPKQIMVQSSTNGPVLCPSPSVQQKECNPTPTKSKINSVDRKISLASLCSNPRLGMGCKQGMIDFSEPITKQQIRSAKMNAIKWVQDHGKITAKDPNQVRASSQEKLEKSAKRQREDNEREERNTKRTKMNDKFKELLAVKSSHTDLIEKSYDEEKEKYFDKLEAKERMEEKMMNTFKVNCKAVTCLTCKYTAFSASDMCKEKRHSLRVVDAVKRFFKCADCGNRTVSLYRMPSHTCGKCNGSSWARAAMMDERRTVIAAASLSIRGAEEQFIGSAVKNDNLNLLVPDED
ncbi:protein MCM10 homolog [Odontomachus brunneus]|uniref:protein MCM10 homolog n=1 Tax=Odontomachus brunneus TaxID=486640 RepID=UPI0013F24E92|nr:protein MCM10 homolog [Odontomachus brunneus]